MKEVNTRSFEAFNEEDVTKILEHSLELQGQDSMETIIKKFGSVEDYRTFVAQNLKEEKVNAFQIKMYGSKEKAIEASLQSTGDRQELKKQPVLSYILWMGSSTDRGGRMPSFFDANQCLYLFKISIDWIRHIFTHQFRDAFRRHRTAVFDPIVN